MVSDDKFYIYGGGRWREVDAGSGRIDGWGRARFLVARAGKLETARSGPVLAALRALAAAEPSAAREGPPLPYKYPQRTHTREAYHNQHCNHCQHNNRSSPKKPLEHKASVAIQCNSNKEAAVQTTLQSQATRSDSIKQNPVGKRRRDSTSSEELTQTKVVTVATVHSPRKPPPPKRYKNSTSSSQISPKKAESLKRKRSSSSSEDCRGLILRSPNKISSKLKKAGPLKRQRSSSKESLILQMRKISDEIWKTNRVRKYLQPKSTSNGLSKRLTRQNVSLVISSDESSFETKKTIEHVKKQKYSDQVIKHKPGSKRAVEPYSADEPSQKLSRKKSTESQTENRFQFRNSQQDACKELVIGEQDVEILRLFLQKHYPDEELYKFDTDDEYKKMHFYRINPLVNIERCPQIARMLRSNSQNSELSLLDFASKLGLKSVSQVTKPKRYRTRRRTAKNYTDSVTNKEDKENINKPARSKLSLTSDKVLRESLNKGNKGRDEIQEEQRGKKEKNNSKVIDNTMDTVELSSESEREEVTEELKQESKEAKIKKPVLKKPKPKAVISTKRGASKEYSNLEDHAIVSWVSAGARASSVNGNRLWKQLQEQYQRLTGQGRTWHSLRNRYLRYILPRLGELALPHTHQARLRAAAATGELKARKKEPRRNSIFALPPRGASSRRPRPAPTPTPTPAPAPTTHRRRPDTGGPPPPRTPRAPTPRYSDVTRQFALKHRSRHSSESTHRSHNNATNDKITRKSRSFSPKRISRRRSPSWSSDSHKSSDHSDENRRKSPRRKSRQKSLTEKLRSRRRIDSDDRKSPSRSPDSNESINHSDDNRRKSPRRKSRQKSHTESRRSKSTNSSDNAQTQSNERKSRSPRHKSMHKPPTDYRRQSNKRKSPRKLTNSRDNSPKQSNDRKSRQKSPTESRRRSNRRKSPSKATNSIDSKRTSRSPRRKSNRRESPSKSTNSIDSNRKSRSPRRKSNRRSPTDSTRRKSNRRKSPQMTKQKSPSESEQRSPSKSTKQKSPTMSRQRSPSENKQNVSPTKLLRSHKKIEVSPVKRTRKLFNHVAVL